MAIQRISLEKCIGCGKCAASCTADVIAMDRVEHKACVRYPEDCILCCWCIAECPTSAIIMTSERYGPLLTPWG